MPEAKYYKKKSFRPTKAIFNSESIDLVKEVRANLAEFCYDPKPEWYDSNDTEIETKDEVTLDNGAKYIGQWKNGLKFGRGVQIWKDGSVYEGYWHDNKAKDRGRLIHADGDVYEGEWKDDKACGFGTYTHTNGATYIGEWLADLQHGKGTERWEDNSQY